MNQILNYLNIEFISRGGPPYLFTYELMIFRSGHSPSNRIVCYRVASAQDLVLAYRAGAHDAALSYDAAGAGKKKVLHCGYVIKLYSM